MSPRRVLAVLAGLATLGVAWARGPVQGVALRLLTGAALAGVYPPGMKVVAGWYREGRGLVGCGALGCWLGGKYADRWGRTLVTSAAMAVSGACALAAGVVFGRPLAVLVPLLLVWGVAVVADSAQFSAAVSELAPRVLVGTALTLQTSLGFLLTCFTIYLLPLVADQVGWRWSMAALALGPVGGVWAMLALRRRPEAVALAGGRR